MNRSLTQSTLEQVRQALITLRSQAEPETCLLCDSAGNVIEREGSGPWDNSLVTALAAGVYGASRELARILGQDEFDSVLNQGEKTNIFFQCVTEDLLLVTVYSETASTGLIKLYAAQAAQTIRRVLAHSGQDGQGNDGAPSRLVLKHSDAMFSAGARDQEESEQKNEPQAVGKA